MDQLSWPGSPSGNLIDISRTKQSLLKIDVQGYEYNVLEGISETQFKSIKWIYLEMMQKKFTTKQKYGCKINGYIS